MDKIQICITIFSKIINLNAVWFGSNLKKQHNFCMFSLGFRKMKPLVFGLFLVFKIHFFGQKFYLKNIYSVFPVIKYCSSESKKDKPPSRKKRNMKTSFLLDFNRN